MYCFFSVPVFQWSARLTQTPTSWRGICFPVTGLRWHMTWCGWGHWPDSEHFLTFSLIFIPLTTNRTCQHTSTVKLSSSVAPHGVQTKVCDTGASEKPQMSTPVCSVEGSLNTSPANVSSPPPLPWAF